MLALWRRFGLWFGILAIAMMVATPGETKAQWPPFSFDLDSAYQDGKIVYNIRFSKKVDGPLADVVFKIPLPEGTRFVEAGAPPTTGVDFDGAEITFLSPVLHRTLQDAYFVVEVVDADRAEFTTHAWIAWKGDLPGDYLTGDYSIDINRAPLAWQKPRSRLRLEAGAIVNGEVATYLLYPKNVGGRRLWDLNILVPLPAGTTFLSAEAPPPFEAGFDGQQAVFSVLELERNVDVEPLQVKVSTAGVTEPFLTTRAQATWINAGRNVESLEGTETGEIIVQPNTNQIVASDVISDTPIANYDLTGVSFQEDATTLGVTFFTAGDKGPVGGPLEQFLYIDSDCDQSSGRQRGNRGAEYWIRYRHQNGRGYIYDWDSGGDTWTNRRTLVANPVTGRLATVWIPKDYIEVDGQLCWLALSINRTAAYHPNPPVDWIGREPRLTQFSLSANHAIQ
jgi:hypothetical protein